MKSEDEGFEVGPAEIAQIRRTIGSLEREHNEDLAVHLYSAHLLRKKDRMFPRNQWTAWPVSSHEVPDPKVLDEYVDEPETERVLKYREMVFASDGCGEEDQERGEDDEEPQPVDEVERATKYLELELDRAFKRVVYDRISRSEHERYGGEPNIEHLSIPQFLSDSIRQKIDDTLERFTDHKTRNAFNMRAFTWRDIVSEANADVELQQRVGKFFTEDSDKFLEEFYDKHSSSEDEHDEDGDDNDEEDIIHVDDDSEDDNSEDDNSEDDNNDQDTGNNRVRKPKGNKLDAVVDARRETMRLIFQDEIKDSTDRHRKRL
ncbi:Rrn9p CYBJADRAFT_7387 [Cyberlindnera jadinii NRRL Y-1542]|uniref:Rrn9 domain-containing protein n=1 Tax=Cyberlindnera jadinii (strain ATCC 18201 / CBS 1600 / BCRC 20928 / JCM 3617 / NBRC 0987 / NRRL Y-1542) TaxID=983966 RepID=A0A1E4S9F0_CYBJN|nr:hypothetical protein CYBJADRAFT_7387 [Cyberlindnera jadinii NRRL Y-1542]ODV76123.1 hypothetical protein CYBJADRAFT_7387 [Cyberlindnera jadinii NRRL Y-1542]